jgi:beta-glucuronidase
MREACDTWTEHHGTFEAGGLVRYPFFPQETVSRDVKSLDGIWRIAFGSGDAPTVSAIPEDARSVAVPGSFNDQFPEREIRNFCGLVAYYRAVFIPRQDGREALLRFGSVNYRAAVYLDGECLGRHSGGHLPFAVAVPDDRRGRECLLCVVVDTRLSWETIPPGEVKVRRETETGEPRVLQTIHFDFFHYCGLHRSVHLLQIPRQRIVDVTLVTRSADAASAVVLYQVEIEGAWDTLRIRLWFKGRLAAEMETDTTSGTIEIASPILWDAGQGHLYDVDIELLHEGELLDQARERIGIRTIAVTEDAFLLNGKPIYFKGFGRHEDFAITGRYLPDAVLVHDFEIMRWMGANSFRTTHYPYSEETMRLADEQGVLVIDETPAVGLFTGWGSRDEPGLFSSGRITPATLREHRQLLAEMIARDKNRPSVVMWSVANEASTKEDACVDYFSNLASYARSLDPTRPITNVLHGDAGDEKTAHLFDVICVNRYVGWYDFTGELDVIPVVLGRILDAYRERFRKPVLFSEFGADTVAGMHAVNGGMFTEEFQEEYLARCFAVLDQRPWIMGEHVWNFADFMTKQGLTRVNGNKKGLFTRDRAPKLAVHSVRRRWLSN